MKQDYEQDRLVGWTTSEEGRGSIGSPMIYSTCMNS